MATRIYCCLEPQTLGGIVANPMAERIVGTVRRECLDRMLVLRLHLSTADIAAFREVAPATRLPACRPFPQADRLTAKNSGTKTSSTMDTLKVDFAEETPLYQQVAAEIRRAIADGEARPGERMPLAKDLATVLGVNTNTVLRALRELRDEGMLEFRRGRGITVAGTPERGVVMARVKDLVAFARQQGYQPAEVIAMIEAVS